VRLSPRTFSRVTSACSASPDTTMRISRSASGTRSYNPELDLADSPALTRWLESDALPRFLRGSTTALLVNNAGVLQRSDRSRRRRSHSVACAVAVTSPPPRSWLRPRSSRRRETRADRRILHISSGAGTTGVRRVERLLRDQSGARSPRAMRGAGSHAEAAHQQPRARHRGHGHAGGNPSDHEREVPGPRSFRRDETRGTAAQLRSGGRAAVEFLLSDRFAVSLCRTCGDLVVIHTVASSTLAAARSE